MSHLLFLIVLGFGCGGADGPDDPVITGAPTAGFPSFYGEPPRNLWIISIDTTRRDLMERYGGPPGLMPFLDQLAAEGAALDQHVSCSNWTMASVLCAQTGQDGLDLGFVPRLQENTKGPIPDTAHGLAYWLREAGYYTVLSSGNSWFSREWNMDLGFTFGYPANTGNATSLFAYGLTPLLAARVQGVADRWYYHLHLVEPHAPYNPPDEYLGGLAALPPYPIDLSVKEDHYDIKKDWPDMPPEEQALLEKHLRVRYQAELRYMDDQIRAFFEQADALGLLDDTLVVVWTDHGEEFWEHGDQTHAYSLHSGENDAIAFFWAKNIVPAQWSEPTSHIDIAPTILTALGLPVPEEVTGLPAGTAPADRPLFGLAVSKEGTVQSVRTPTRKLIYTWTGGTKEFHWIDSDPGEWVNKYDPEDPEVLALWDLLLPKVEAAEVLIPEYRPANPGP